MFLTTYYNTFIYVYKYSYACLAKTKIPTCTISGKLDLYTAVLQVKFRPFAIL